MAALIPDKNLVVLASWECFLSYGNTADYIRDQYCHIQADGTPLSFGSSKRYLLVAKWRSEEVLFQQLEENSLASTECQRPERGSEIDKQGSRKIEAQISFLLPGKHRQIKLQCQFIWVMSEASDFWVCSKFDRCTLDRMTFKQVPSHWLIKYK